MNHNSNCSSVNNNISKEPLDRVFTIPNMLSLFRIVLIPFFIWLYVYNQNYIGTSLLLILSGATDIIDGFIARRFNAVSNLGKVLDPIADKLTQITMLACLLTRFPLITILIILFVFKESFMMVTGYLVIKNANHVYGAEWHGKIVTFLLYAIIFLHIIWYNIPVSISNICIYTSIIFMIVSLFLYGFRNITAIIRKKPE